jgi:hypothetical protein
MNKIVKKTMWSGFYPTLTASISSLVCSAGEPHNVLSAPRSPFFSLIEIINNRVNAVALLRYRPAGGDTADWRKHLEFPAGANVRKMVSPKVQKCLTTDFNRH